MSTTVALIGAGGKMGTRLRRNLATHSDYTMLYAEKSPQAAAALEKEGFTVVEPQQAATRADITILAVPDRLIGAVSAGLTPVMPGGSTLLLLDPAAAMAGEVADAPGISRAVCHPCHPPLFGDQPKEKDFFGGIAAEQDVVAAFMSGDETVMASIDGLCAAMFAPVGTVHRITVEQMAILEPAMAEVVGAAAAVLMKEAMDEAITAGVPEKAARAFMLGHAQIPLAIAFGAIDSPFSDGAKIAISYGQRHCIRENWREVFSLSRVKECIDAMIHPQEH